MEQLYPFPDDPADVDDNIQAVLTRYPNVKDLVWAQEEPRNMGAWSFVEPRFRETLPPKLSIRYIGRKDAASPAAGSHRAHHDEQEHIVDAVLS